MKNQNGADGQSPHRGVMAFTLIAGTCAAALPVLAVVVMLLAHNPHLDQGLDTTQAVSLATWLTLAAGSLWGLVEMTRPGTSGGAWKLLLPAPLILGGGLAAEFARTPHAGWTARLVGSNPAACFTLITLFSLPILSSTFYVLRGVTLAAPAKAGAFAGLLAAATAALIYTWHCPAESLLYIATWHELAIVAVATISAILGRTYLRSSPG